MHVTLDQERWEVGAPLTVGEVLADVSERAHARARIVTSLRLDHRTITDRDLDHAFLSEPASRFAQLTAVSQSMQAVLEAAQPSVKKYAEALRGEGTGLIHPLRFGQSSLGSLDAWLGKLADYLESVEGAHAPSLGLDGAQALSPWVRQLLDARAVRDTIRMADLLEYEILPRMGGQLA
jgi:hypothetical protein